MCCLPRYAQAAGVEPKPFTTNIPTYGVTQETTLEPPPGAVIVKKGWLAQWNPFDSSDDAYKPREPSPDQQASADSEQRKQRTLGAAVAVLRMLRGTYCVLRITLFRDSAFLVSRHTHHASYSNASLSPPPNTNRQNTDGVSGAAEWVQFRSR